MIPIEWQLSCEYFGLDSSGHMTNDSLGSVDMDTEFMKVTFHGRNRLVVHWVGSVMCSVFKRKLLLMMVQVTCLGLEICVTWEVVLWQGSVCFG